MIVSDPTRPASSVGFEETLRESMPEGDCKADVEVAATIKDGVAEGMVELSLHEYWLDIPTASNELSHLFIPNVANDREQYSIHDYSARTSSHLYGN